MIRFFIFLICMGNFTLLAHADNELVLVGPNGLGADGKPLQIANAGASAAKVAAANAHGASTAAQAIAASQQAAIMFRLLMAKGVMDYFQRKEMDKANELLSKKMERLQQELRSGKLNAAEYAAIKSAVEETYAKYSKMDAPKDKAVAADLPGSDKNSKSLGSDSLSGNLGVKDESGKPELQSGSSDLARMDSQSSGFKDQSAKETHAQDSSQGNSVGGPVSQHGLMPASGGIMFGNAQPPAQQTVSIQNSIQNDSGFKDKGLGAQGARELASSNLGGMGFDGSPDFESEDGMIPVETVEGEREYDGHYSLVSDRTPSQAQLGSSFYNLLKPIKFQKNPFSTRLQTEEGLHLGLLVLILGAAFALGLGLKKEKKIPRVIPEVILTPERNASKHSRSLELQPIRNSRRRGQRV